MGIRSDYSVYVLDLDEDAGECLSFISYLRELKTSPRVMILAGSGDETAAEEAIKRGFSFILRNPVTKADIRELMARFEDRREQEESDLADMSASPTCAEA